MRRNLCLFHRSVASFSRSNKILWRIPPIRAEAIRKSLFLVRRLRANKIGHEPTPRTNWSIAKKKTLSRNINKSFWSWLIKIHLYFISKARGIMGVKNPVLQNRADFLRKSPYKQF
jgi:hypothetical protein